MINKRINIAYITFCLDVGGIENLILRICKAIDKTKFSPFIFTFQENGKLKEEFEKEGIPVFVINKKNGIAPMLTFKLAILFKKLKIDLVNTHNQSPWLYGGIAAKIAGIPLLHTQHTTHDYLAGKGNRWKYIERFLAFLTSQITTVSKSVADYMIQKEKIPEQKIKVIYNGIDIQRYNIEINNALKRNELGVNKNDYIVGNIASLLPKKDQQTLIKAFQLVVKKLPESKLLIAGDGPLKTTLLNLTKELGLEGKVIFLGNRKDIPELLQSIDVFVLSSLMEGLPIALLEAMAAGLPAIATDVDGNPETILHNETGIIVKARDVEGLANAIHMLLTDKIIAKKFAEAASKRVKEYFSFERMLANYEETYDKLVNR